MKYVDNSGKVDLSGWNLDTDKVMSALHEEVSELLGLVVEDLAERAYGYFPIEWAYVGDDPCDGISGKPVFDPSIIYVRVGRYDEDFPAWSLNLKDIVQEMIDDGSNDNGKLVETKALEAVRDNFRSLADMIDKKLPRTNQLNV